MSRGNALVAGVVLIGILSTLAIGLDNLAPRPVAAVPQQVAAVAQAQLAQTSGSASTKDPLANVATTCEKGFDYQVTAKGDTQCIPKLSGFYCEDRPKQDAAGATGGKATPQGCDVSKLQKVNKPDEVPQCKEPSQVTFCFNNPSGGVKCQNIGPCMPGAALNGDSIKKGIANTLADPNVSAADKQALTSALKADPALSKGISDAFSEQNQDIANQLRTQQNGKDAAQSELNNLLNNRSDACANPGSDACLASEKREAELHNDIALRDKRIAELGEQQKRLAAASQSLQPGTNPDNQNNGGTGGGGGGNPPPRNQDTFNRPPVGSAAPPPPGSGGGLPPPPGGGGGGPGTGNQTPYQPGTCAPAYRCSGNTLYYRNNTCVDQPQQYCQYGCAQTSSGFSSSASTGCAQSPQTPQNPNNPDPNAAQPTAEISSCTPKIVDVDKKVTVAYKCTNAVSSTGTNFSTTGQTEGTVEVTMQKPPVGINTIGYGVVCTAQNGQTATAPICEVEINQPLVITVANPSDVSPGDDSTIGWVTKGMSSCVISSPDLPGFTEDNQNKMNVNGTAKTPELSDDATFVLTCETRGGNKKYATTTVSVTGSASGDEEEGE
jgi:hypothetical protein